ncbi:MAG TPA: signal peptidase II [Eggerthellaceae bacterium]|nr:signal peptidase II [Eggerthellaceae bacterium]
MDRRHALSKTAKIILYAAIVVAWTALDQYAKSLFAGMKPDGSVLAGPFAGLVDIRLVHNTGAAWGMFADNTIALGVFSIVVCVAIAAAFFATVRSSSVLQTVSLALITAGGVGNAIDRFSQGYVVDFIEFSFFDFPVFNIADIGVTCGFALLVISLITTWNKEGQN